MPSVGELVTFLSSKNDQTENCYRLRTAVLLQEFKSQQLATIRDISLRVNLIRWAGRSGVIHAKELNRSGRSNGSNESNISNKSFENRIDHMSRSIRTDRPFPVISSKQNHTTSGDAAGQLCPFHLVSTAVRPENAFI